MEESPDSALHLLQKISPANYKSPSHRALYGLILFHALDKKEKPLQPDSLIDFSINHYLAKNEKLNLAKSYFYKARMLMKRQHFEDAVKFYLNALDLLKSTENYYLLGRIYSGMSDICAIQNDLNGSLRKNWLAVNYFNKAGNKFEANYRTISVGKIYHFQRKFEKALHYYRQALSQSSDSIIVGVAFQEIGVNYFWAKQYDSAQYYLRKSLKYPFRGTNYAIRCFNMADLFFYKQQYDSSFFYASLALKHPTTFYNQRDCYRILANSEYQRGDFDKMGVYMHKYQDYSDSIRKIETQSKASVLENLHDNIQKTTGTKRSMIWTVLMLFIVLMFSAVIVYLLLQRNNLRKMQLDIYREELNQKQVFVSQNLSRKITETRNLQTEARRSASPEERAELDKELYEKCLHLSNWDTFSCEMNHAFNQIVDVLQSDYSGITQKEITWCCLHLLDITNADRILLLNATTDSIYKLKQRLAQKMNLKSTKELDKELKRISNLQI
ncbi:MAG TPA: hypothetical protein VFK73_04890 [Paludibacter sp.]|nr:hypothetical protein [Paludibacter sp.]